MAAEDGRNRAWHGEIEGRSSVFITSLFHESASQKVGRPKKITKVYGFCCYTT